MGIAAEGKTDSLCGGTIIGMEEELVRTNCGPSMDSSGSVPASTAGTVHTDNQSSNFFRPWLKSPCNLFRFSSKDTREVEIRRHCDTFLFV